jgi:MFS family permease
VAELTRSAQAASPRRFGWSVVAAAFGAQAVSIGLSVSSYPVFMQSLETELGATRSQTSLGIPIALMAGALVSPWIGRLLDRGSPRRVMACGALLLAAGLVAVSQSPHLVWAALAWVAIVGPGKAMLGPLPAMTVLARWFVARRGTMIALAAMGTTFGGAIAPPVGQWLIEAIGWRGAVACLGLAAAAIGVPVVLAGIVGSPADVGLHPDGASAPPEEASDAERAAGESGPLLRDPRFWSLALCISLLTGSSVAFVTHVVPWAGERGIAREAAVVVLTISALCTSAGKLVFGVGVDRLGARAALSAAVACEVLGWLAMIGSPNAPVFFAGAALFALGVGCQIPCQAGFVAALYGRAQFGRVSGVLGLVAMAGMPLLPSALGLAYDALGGYDLAMKAMLLVLPFPALLTLPLVPRPRAAAAAVVRA